mmetsp:Transcript_76744/g.206814  ORF Transcript_76744/g.206814 Transcript_76744/m.206814 type:complete len:215 (-) Transcript_76744:502-1146(-)
MRCLSGERVACVGILLLSLFRQFAAVSTLFNPDTPCDRSALLFLCAGFGQRPRWCCARGTAPSATCGAAAWSSTSFCAGSLPSTPPSPRPCSSTASRKPIILSRLPTGTKSPTRRSRRFVPCWWQTLGPVPAPRPACARRGWRPTAPARAATGILRTSPSECAAGTARENCGGLCTRTLRCRGWSGPPRRRREAIGATRGPTRCDRARPRRSES